MVTKYYGGFCADDKCGHFIVINSYQVERPELVGVQFRPPKHAESLQCPVCGLTRIYREADIFHSSSPDGKAHQYRQKC